MCVGTFCPCADDVFHLCALIRGKKNKNCEISAAAHLQSPGEPAYQPADYLRAPQGLPSLLHKHPQLNTSHSLVLSLLPLFLSSCYAFILHRRAPSVLSQLSHFSLILLCSRSIFSTPRSASPLAVSQASCQPAAPLQLFSLSLSLSRHPWLPQALTERQVKKKGTDLVENQGNHRKRVCRILEQKEKWLKVSIKGRIFFSSSDGQRNDSQSQSEKFMDPDGAGPRRLRSGSHDIWPPRRNDAS